MICESCGRTASTQPATLYQNIGMIAALRHRTLKGNYCRPCITHYFWEYTLVTLVLGWWGMISFFLTPLILVSNLFYFVRMQLGRQRPNLGLPPQALGTTIEACPRCQTFQARPAGLSRSVWISIVVGLLLLVWAGYLSVQPLTSRGDWVIIGLFVGINVLAAVCLAMLLRHPLRQCVQCGWTWPMMQDGIQQ